MIDSVHSRLVLLYFLYKKKKIKIKYMSFHEHHWEHPIRAKELKDESSFSSKTIVGTYTLDDNIFLVLEWNAGITIVIRMVSESSLTIMKSIV